MAVIVAPCNGFWCGRICIGRKCKSWSYQGIRLGKCGFSDKPCCTWFNPWKIHRTIFGAGSILIKVFLVLSFWFYAKERATLTGVERWQQICILLATCSLPLPPGTSVELAPCLCMLYIRIEWLNLACPPIASSMRYGIMSFLVIGWGLTIASHFVAARSTQDITKK